MKHSEHALRAKSSITAALHELEGAYHQAAAALEAPDGLPRRADGGKPNDHLFRVESWLDAAIQDLVRACYQAGPADSPWIAAVIEEHLRPATGELREAAALLRADDEKETT